MSTRSSTSRSQRRRAPALKGPAQWCDILILHLNTKYCRAVGAPRPTLQVRIGRKFDQPLAEAYKVDFALPRRGAPSADYLRVQMRRRQRPARHPRLPHHASRPRRSTRKRTFLHLSYAYAYGVAARVAMQGYLSTLRHATRSASPSPAGTPAASPSTSAACAAWSSATRCATTSRSRPTWARWPRPLRSAWKSACSDWFAATERYPRQLHEMDRDDYLTMKRQEYSASRRPSPDGPAAAGGTAGGARGPAGGARRRAGKAPGAGRGARCGRAPRRQRHGPRAAAPRQRPASKAPARLVGR